MLTDTMTYTEISKELNKLNIKLAGRRDGWNKKYSKVIHKQGMNYLSCYKLNTNLYFILYCGNENYLSGYGFIYLVLRNNRWVAITQGTVDKNFRVEIEIYEAHFFSRYKERFNVDKQGIELICHYFKNNMDIFNKITIQEHNNKTYQLSNIKGGLAICEVVDIGGKAVWLYKTCICQSLLKEKQIKIKEQIEIEINEIRRADFKYESNPRTHRVIK